MVALPEPGMASGKGSDDSRDGHRPETTDIPGAALYIACLAHQLARLAKNHDLDALAYILEMARLEADQISKRWARYAPGGGCGPD
jgi:methyl coenzyme M reductase subunit C-like uncharacterized protein (methanogenesis marker protein 7)